MVALHPSAAITAAGLAAAGVCITAMAEAGLRPRRGSPSRLAVSLVAMLTLAAALLCLLGLAAGNRLR
jgi:hypothetical protein